MSVETKRREILQMLARGVITAQEAGDMLSQIENNIVSAAVEPAAAPEEPVEQEVVEEKPTGYMPRWLHIKVAEGDRTQVLVKLPFKLAEWGLRLGAKIAPVNEYIDWDELLDQISHMGEETLIDVQDQVSCDHVQIYVS